MGVGQESDQAGASAARRALRAVRWFLQLALTLVIALFAPFVAYAVLGKAGLDVSVPAYGLILAGLLLTTALLISQGTAAVRGARDAPAGPSAPRTGRFFFDVGSRSGPLRAWLPTYVWLAPQPIPLAVYWLWRYGVQSRDHLIALIVLGCVYILHRAPAEAVFASIVARRSGARLRGGVLGYMLTTMLLSGGVENERARILQLGEVIGSYSLPVQKTSRPAASHATVSEQVVGATPVGEEIAEPLPSFTEPPLETAAAETSAPPEETGPTEPATLSAVNVRAQAVEMVHDLGNVVLMLVKRRDEREAKRARLAERLQTLEGTLDARRTLTMQMRATADDRVPEVQLQGLEYLLERLRRNPEDLVALTQVTQNANLLAQVVRGYTYIQKALETERVHSRQ